MAGEKIIEQTLLSPPEAPASQAEQISSPETKIEQAAKKTEKPLEPLTASKVFASPVAAVSSKLNSLESQRAAAIDLILEEGLNEIFLKMNPLEQAAFKKKGEETVSKINILLGQTKVKINKIIGLIRDWLKMLPGINKFFLEQETKIKADKIIKIKNRF